MGRDSLYRGSGLALTERVEVGLGRGGPDDGGTVIVGLALGRTCHLGAHHPPPRGAATGVGHTSRAVEDMAWAGGESFGCADIVVGAVEETSALGGEAKEEEEECERF